MKRAFGVFAYNEERKITECLESILSECDSNIYVLINGCTDDTQKVVRNFAINHPVVKPIIIEVGDKSNAWNVYIHELDIDAEIYYFVDGDCTISSGAIAEIESKANIDSYNAISCTPKGTSKKRINASEEMLRNGGLMGNFYGLTSQFVSRLRRGKIKLPFGTIGEDGLVGALAYWDLKPFTEWNLDKVLVLKDANFDYDSLSPTNLDDLRLYYRRRIRYSMRHFQNKIITQAFKDDGLQGLTESFDAMYEKYPELLKLKWRGLNTYFDAIALKRISSRG